ncbi:uncharacterized protein J4E79_004420 [Alternaria viburni]|uniref:uncharacterized protein n=1 Tax=Alternaria viburni TaxID=566460 RepID=UPI0020C23A8E|nr:uncharacterized protein J4E79_004420 [Alternaria viburni]KAI4663106.1 hypothetical protein J4E79_004420 [Alternaria viburni]
MKFIKQIAQRLNPDLHIPGTDNPPPAVLRKSKSSTTLLVTEKRKELSTPPSQSSLRKKASSMFLGRGKRLRAIPIPAFNTATLDPKLLKDNTAFHANLKATLDAHVYQNINQDHSNAHARHTIHTLTA